MDGVNAPLGSREMTVEAAKHSAEEEDKDWKTRRAQGPDFRKVLMLRNGAVRTKQNLSTAHEFVVC